MDIAEDLRQDLLARWKALFDRVSLLAEAAGRGLRTLYATGDRFGLKAYTPGKFPAGGRTSKNPIPGCDNWVYLLNAAGRPVHVAMRHSFNQIDWQGMYAYGTAEAEYTEFCITTQIPSEYTRLALSDGQPASFQRLRVQCRGALPDLRGMSPGLQAERILSDPYLHEIEIETYDLQDGRVQSGWAWTEAPRIPPHLSMLAYSYSDDGKLQRIVANSELGGTRTVFAARTKTSLKQLSSTLSQRIAGRIIEALQKASFDSPLVAVALPYHPPDNYVPSVVPGTQADAERMADLCLVVAVDSKRWIELVEEDFAPEITEFADRIDYIEQSQTGAKMVRQAARMVTEFGRGQPWAAENFVAFAIDWEFEGGDLADILKECGADGKTLREWTQRGWL
ncbi:MAG: hypothetical protein ABSH50_32680 [Bryobacteraceae bacterium]|jgi:hypothetical protein